MAAAWQFSGIGVAVASWKFSSSRLAVAWQFSGSGVAVAWYFSGIGVAEALQ